jgi:hypothetical protein
LSAKARSDAQSVLDGHAGSGKLAHAFSDEKRRRDGRLTGGVLLVIAAGLVALVVLRHGGLAERPWLVRIATLLALLSGVALLAPVRFHTLWMAYVAAPLGWLSTRVILSLAFFLGFTPYALVLRILGRDPLARRPREGSYWIPRAKRDRKHFERSF